MFSKTNNISLRIINRNFSSLGHFYINQSNKSTFPYMIASIGIVGLSYIIYKTEKNNAEYYNSLSFINKKQSDRNVDLRIKDTLTYCASEIALTALISNTILSSSSLLQFSNGFIGKIISSCMIYCSYKGMISNNRTNSTKGSLMRNLCFLGFNTGFALSMTPILNYMGSDIVKQGMLWTGGFFTTMTLGSYFLKKTSHLRFSGVLSSGMGGLIALGFANTFFKSKKVYDYYIYGGLGLMAGYALFDFQNFKIKARSALDFDPFIESLKIYGDVFNLFLFALGVIEDRKKSKFVEDYKFGEDSDNNSKL